MNRRVFFSACASPLPNVVMSMVRGGTADVNTIFDSGKTALHYAVRHLDVPLVTFLLDVGARVDASSSTGWSLLNLALYEAAINEHPDSVDALKVLIPMLHQAGATYDSNDVRGARALVYYGSLKMLHWFFSHGANPLSILDLIGYLAENCVDLNTMDTYGKTRLHKAVEHGSMECVRALIQAGADVNVNGRAGTPLLGAATRGDVEILRELLNRGANPALAVSVSGLTPLLAAISSGNLVAVMLLIQSGSSIDERDNLGLGVLHKAISVWSKDPTIFSALLSLGADVMNHAEGAYDSLPLLHYAARCGCTGAMEELLKHGVPVDLVSPGETGVTALHIACMLGRIESARLLLKHGANPMLGDNSGTLPLAIAIRQNEAGIVRLFASLNCAINGCNARGEAPLHYAANASPVELVDVLVQAGAVVDARDNDGWTPLHFAAHSSQDGVLLYLIEREADVNARDRRGRTPLHIAASHRRTASVKTLLEEGALHDARNSAGLTPAECAKAQWAPDCARMIEEAAVLTRIA